MFFENKKDMMAGSIGEIPGQIQAKNKYLISQGMGNHISILTPKLCCIRMKGRVILLNLKIFELLQLPLLLFFTP